MGSLLAGHALNVWITQKIMFGMQLSQAVLGNEQFLNLQVAYPKSGKELYFVVTLCYMAEYQLGKYGGCMSFRSTLSSKSKIAQIC